MNATPRGLDVVILGAGFSKAVSSHLPLTDELGMFALLRLPDGWRHRAPSHFVGGTFETWLSRLADDQPQLSEAENQENRALFAHTVEAITSELADRQRKALTQAAPPWLYELLSVLHCGRHTAITLNYDILVEAGLQGHALWCNGPPTDPNNPARSSPGRFAGIGDVLGGLPDLRARSGQTIYTDELTASPEQTFQLLKLHGSLDWYWVPGDASGPTLNRSILRPRFGTELPTRQDYANELPGREPFIVPPLAAKSAYFRNPVIREIRRKALAALRRADRIHLVGYPGALRIRKALKFWPRRGAEGVETCPRN